MRVSCRLVLMSTGLAAVEEGAVVLQAAEDGLAVDQLRRATWTRRSTRS